MKFFNKIFGRHAVTVDDEPHDRQLEDLMIIFGKAGLPVKESCDELPGAHGAFGVTFTNPIPVNGPIGEIVYLNLLRRQNSTGFLFHRLGHTSSPICDQMVDVYELVTLDASHWMTLYFSMYHPRRSNKAPDGTFIKQWSTVEPQFKAAIKLACLGSGNFVENFPFGLPDSIRNDDSLRALSAGMPEAFAGRVTGILDRNRGKWLRPQSGTG